MPVELAFTEECEAWRLESRFFPSKVGGRPAWLDLKNIPKKEDVECEYCKHPCIFLCQVYAPYEENEDAFHRTLYLFVCKNANCCKVNQYGNFKVFRSQLGRFNCFYPAEPPIEEDNWRTDICAENWCKTCHICGIYAPSHCSRCKFTNYCCRDHQVFDWKRGHKDSCGIKTDEKKNFLFPEYELVMEMEENCDENDEEEVEEKEMEKYKEMMQREEAGTLQNENVTDDLSKMATEEDETFTQFRTKVEKYPDQVLRYERNGQILYISGDSQIGEVPKCPLCGEERQFEFQIMPQLLNYLYCKDVDSLDWGVVAVFTCKKSCPIKDRYVEEYVWKQDIVPNKCSNNLLENKIDDTKYL